MSKGSGITRGDRRRNAQKARLRGLVPVVNAVAGVDLGEKKQVLAVMGLDGQVLGRRSVQVTVHGLGTALDWAVARARAAGFAGLSVACEPTGSRWMIVQELCAQRGLPMVCVQPLVTHVAREQQDLTGDKTDEGDCVLIARLARELHCYVPERLEGLQADLREAGRCRAQVITNATAAKQLIRDKLGLAAPALLGAGSDPLESATWLAGLEVVLEQCGTDPASVTRMGFAAFTALVRARVGGWGGQRAGGTARKLFAALADAGGVVVPARRAALRRARHGLEDLKYARARRGQLEAEMTGLLEGLGIDQRPDLPDPRTDPGHPGRGPGRDRRPAPVRLLLVGRQARRDVPGPQRIRCLPRQDEELPARGPALRLAVWRATWAVLRHCGVLAAKHAALTSRHGPGRLADGQC